MIESHPALIDRMPMQNRTTSTDDRTHERFLSTFPASVASLVEPRRAFARWLADEGLDESMISELTVVFSELTSNAAAVAPDEESIRVEAWREDDQVVLSVVNPPPDEPIPVRQWDLDDPLRGGGRGLMIVRAYTDSIEASTADHGGLAVRCRRRTITGR